MESPRVLDKSKHNRVAEGLSFGESGEEKNKSFYTLAAFLCLFLSEFHRAPLC
jgi:hypothetical protein